MARLKGDGESQKGARSVWLAVTLPTFELHVKPSLAESLSCMQLDLKQNCCNSQNGTLAPIV